MANKAAIFLKEVVEELKKVSWTTKQELMDSTIIVLVSLFILAAFVGAVDWALALIIRKLMGL